MPTNRTKRSRARTRLDHWKIDQLVTGQFLIAGLGYMAPDKHLGGASFFTDPDRAALIESVRADWREIGADFMGWWRGESEQFSATYASIGGKRREPGLTPWALTEFGEPTCD